MTDNHDDTPPERTPTDEFTYEKEIIKKLGERGSAGVEQISESTDIDGLSKTKEVTLTSYCTCGHVFLNLEESRRCVSCDGLCCTKCHIRYNRYHYCPQCIRQAFHINKQVFLALYLLDQDKLALEDLVHIDEIGGQPATVTITEAATALLEHDYISTPTDEPAPANTLPLDPDDPLSAQGKEALHVGEQLYTDDPDVKALKEDLEIQQVANNSR